MEANDVYALVLLLAALTLAARTVIREESPLKLFSPLALIAVSYFIYFILGPLVFLFTGAVWYTGRNFEPLFGSAWFACAIGLISTWVGFVLADSSTVARRSHVREVSETSVLLAGGLTLLIGLIGGSVWIIGDAVSLDALLFSFNVDDQTVRGLEASRFNYFYQLINCFVAGILCVLAAHNRRWWLLIPIISVVALLYIAIGFRYRLFFLLIAIFAFTHLRANRAPSKFTVFVVGVVGALGMGIIALSRTYYSGLDIERLGSILSPDEIVTATLGDANIFFALAAIIDAVPDRIPYFYLEPLWYVFVLPIPRFLWPEKPIPQYLEAVRDAIGTSDALFAGPAAPNLGEYYLAFGYMGIIFGSFVFGVVAGLVWKWFKARDHATLAQVSYALALPFFWYAIARGYMAQIAQDAAFTLFPLAILFMLSRAPKGASATLVRSA